MVAPTQAVLIPIVPGKKSTDDERASLHEAVSRLASALREAGIRVQVDDRDYVRPGAKFFEWERRGAPLRVELGPRDLASGTCTVARRVDGAKLQLPLADAAGALRCELDQIQDEMLERARARLNARTVWVSDYSEMNALLVKGSKDGSSKDTPSFFLAPWHADDDNEASVKSDCKATIRCYPEEHQHQAEGKTCFRSGRPATHIALFARAF